MNQYFGDFNVSKTRFNLAFYGGLGVHAAQNHQEITGDWASAINAGLFAMLRWKVWCGCLVVWGIAALLTAHFVTRISYLVGLGADSASGTAWIFGWVVAVIIGWVLCLGPTYVTAVDASLFKQRLLYKINYPIAHALRNIPWWMLSMAALVPWVYLLWQGVWDHPGLVEVPVRR